MEHLSYSQWDLWGATVTGTIFKEPEDYESLKRALDVIAEVEKLTVIEIDGIKYSIQYYLGGDWKFLALVTGGSDY